MTRRSTWARWERSQRRLGSSTRSVSTGRCARPSSDVSLLYTYPSVCQHIFDSVKASLKRLQLDYIDLLQCTSRLPHSCLRLRLTVIIGHRFDYTTPIEETVSYVQDMLRGYGLVIGFIDASTSRRSEGGIRPIYRHELLPRLSVYVCIFLVAHV